MNSKRRAELQRKLSMGEVPRPPANLAERIKADIPKHLVPHAPPSRFGWSTTMRVAATFITLITTAVITMELVDRDEAPVRSIARQEQATPALIRYRTSTDNAVQTTAAVTQAGETEVSLDIAQEMPLSAAPESAAAESAAPQVAATAAAAPAPRVAARYERAEGAVTGSTVTQMADAAAPPAAPPPPPVMAAPPEPAAAPQALMATEEAERITVTASAPALETQAATRKSTAPREQKADVFGYSVDPAAFGTIRNAIESGTRPAPASVNVEALVNYFAGAQSSRREVELDVEASPAPIEVEGDVALLRFTVDTAKVDLAPRSATPAVAHDAHLHVDIDPQAVKSFRRIGDNGSEEAEEALLYNTSVTGLYELELKPNLRNTQRIATVRLEYVSAKSNRKQSITRTIRGADLARKWEKASRRHRLAALGALWSETLKGTNGAPEIAKRAEELATQNPSDTRARELATAATLSTGGER